MKPCIMEDIDELRRLSIQTYHETFRRSIHRKIWRNICGVHLTGKKLCRELSDKNSMFFFLLSGEKLAGYLKVNEAPSQTDVNDPASLEIERIYVSGEFQGEGLGRYLMEQAISMAVERKKKYVWLGVWEKNEKAIRFYKRNGFCKIGTHSFVMGDDVQTDHIMRKDLSIS